MNIGISQPGQKNQNLCKHRKHASFFWTKWQTHPCGCRTINCKILSSNRRKRGLPLFPLFGIQVYSKIWYFSYNRCLFSHNFRMAALRNCKAWAPSEFPKGFLHSFWNETPLGVTFTFVRLVIPFSPRIQGTLRNTSFIFHRGSESKGLKVIPSFLLLKVCNRRNNSCWWMSI